MLTFLLELQEPFFSTETVMLKSIFFQVCFCCMCILSSNCGKLIYIETE